MILSLVALDIDHRVELLQTSEIFCAIDQSAFLEYLAEGMIEVNLPENHPILHINEAVKSLYFLIEGRVRIHIDGAKMAELSRGAYFGDINIFEAQSCAASVTTLKSSRCLVLEHERLRAALNLYPDIEPALMAGLYPRQRSLQAQSWRKSVVQEWLTRTQEPHWAYAS